MNRHHRRAKAIFDRHAKLLQEKQAMMLASFLRKHFPYHYVHKDCGKVAFHVQHHPTPGQPILPEWCMFPNGDKPKADEDAKCGSCGGALSHEDLDPVLNLRRTL